MGLSNLQHARYCDAFDCLDTNKNGCIEWSDLERSAEVIRAHFGWDRESAPYRETLEDLRGFWDTVAASMDEDGDGVIGLDEWVGFFTTLARQCGPSARRLPEWARGHVHALLRAVDHNGDGAISQPEYALYLRSIGSDADPDAAFRAMDGDGDGVLELAEVEELYCQWVSSSDPSAPGNLLVTGRTLWD